MRMASQDAYEKVEYINLHHLNYVVALIIYLALLVKLPKFFSQYIITRAVQLVGGAKLNIICGAGASYGGYAVSCLDPQWNLQFGNLHSADSNSGICTAQTAIWESAQRRQQFGNLHSADSNLGICRSHRAQMAPTGHRTTARLGVRDFEIHWISSGFRISEWISGFQSGFLDFWISKWISGFQSGFLDFKVDFWISKWISGFQSGFLDFIVDFSRDFWISSEFLDFKADFWI